MGPTPLSQRLSEFAIELRKLAYSVPGGCEGPLICLSERIARTAEQLDWETISTAVRSPRR